MPQTPEPIALYRLYDAEGQLLYVGIARDPEARWKGAGSVWRRGVRVMFVRRGLGGSRLASANLGGARVPDSVVRAFAGLASAPAATTVSGGRSIPVCYTASVLVWAFRSSSLGWRRRGGGVPAMFVRLGCPVSPMVQLAAGRSAQRERLILAGQEGAGTPSTRKTCRSDGVGVKFCVAPDLCDVPRALIIRT